jgi:molybdate transport system substrate-binding protein
MTERHLIKILCAGAVKEGVRACAELFEERTAMGFDLEHAIGPEIHSRLNAGTAVADLVAMPESAFPPMVGAGQFAAKDVEPVGSILVAAAIRKGAREPDLSTVEAFIASVQTADRLYISAATSGRYMQGIFDKLSLTERLGERIVTWPTGRETMEALAADTSFNAIGFGHATEIRLHDDRGTRLVGPLPGEINRETPYAVGLFAGAHEPAAARDLLDLMVSPRGRELFAETGVSVPR